MYLIYACDILDYIYEILQLILHYVLCSEALYSDMQLDEKVLQTIGLKL